MKINRIFAIGAFDRFNYGDLLFPIISKNFIEKNYPGIEFESVALKKSDFSEYGGLKTRPICDLYRRNGVSDGDVIYFCGGGTLGSDWLSMHANLLGKYGNKILYYTSRLLGYKLANNLSRLRFGGNSEFPWIASPEDFSATVKVIYNSVGGSELSRLQESIRHLALRKLSNASYFSVRDSETKRICADIENKIKVNLAPDSAVLMSEQYPRDFLESKASENLRDMLSKDNYVCFHSNYGYLKKNVSELAVQLEKIYVEHGLKAILLPIGRYVGLDDYLGLMELKDRMKSPVEIVGEDISIWEIMYVISEAKLFVGTSLHGNVTAQSFAVPHIGLSGRKSKLDFYLETWDIPEHSVCSDVSKIYQAANNALLVPQTVRMEKRSQLIELATDNLHNIMKVVLQ